MPIDVVLLRKLGTVLTLSLDGRGVEEKFVVSGFDNKKFQLDSRETGKMIEIEF